MYKILPTSNLSSQSETAGKFHHKPVDFFSQEGVIVCTSKCKQTNTNTTLNVAAQPSAFASGYSAVLHVYVFVSQQY